MFRFCGCIDIHNGQVKQIVGGTLGGSELKTNYVARQSADFFASLYRENNVVRSHVIKLGPGCDEAAALALRGWYNGLQIGGGINADNAAMWIERGASKVIVTSYLFPGGDLDWSRLMKLEQAVGKDRLVIDLSCRQICPQKWRVAMDRWQRITNFELSEDAIGQLSSHCSEFLVHAADVEGLCQGIDEDLVRCLAKWSPIPVVYAGGGKSLDDLRLINEISNGRVDLTFGSALDIFGGTGVRFEDAVKWNQKVNNAAA